MYQEEIWVFLQCVSTPISYYTCIHTVSLALKVRSQRVPMTRITSQLWRDLLTRRSHQLTMNEVQIDDLNCGLKFGKAIELPPELMLNAHQMCDMLVGRGTVRHFTHLRCADTMYVLVGIQYLIVQE